jgi:hypothetical protein
LLVVGCWPTVTHNSATTSDCKRGERGLAQPALAERIATTLAALLSDDDATCAALSLDAVSSVGALLTKVVVMRLHRAKRLDASQPLAGRCAPSLVTALHQLIDACADATLLVAASSPDSACRAGAAVGSLVKVMLCGTHAQ